MPKSFIIQVCVSHVLSQLSAAYREAWSPNWDTDTVHVIILLLVTHQKMTEDNTSDEKRYSVSVNLEKFVIPLTTHSQTKKVFHCLKQRQSSGYVGIFTTSLKITSWFKTNLFGIPFGSLWMSSALPFPQKFQLFQIPPFFSSTLNFSLPD